MNQYFSGLNQSSYDGLSSIVRTSQVAGLTIPRGQLAGTETGAVPKIKPMPGSRGTKGAGLNVEIPVHEGKCPTLGLITHVKLQFMQNSFAVLSLIKEPVILKTFQKRTCFVATCQTLI